MSYILLVEDNQQNADLVIKILQSAGFQVKHTLRGLQGARLAREAVPDLILMDFELPDVTGPTVIMIIRKQLGERTPPVVALTAYNDNAHREIARKIGCGAFIGKPFSPVELLNTVNYFLKRMPAEENVVLL
jgi:two-component system, cell cycle response regulator DivK